MLNHNTVLVDRFEETAVHVVSHVLVKAKSQSYMLVVCFGDKAVYDSGVLRIDIMYILHAHHKQTTKQKQEEYRIAA